MSFVVGPRMLSDGDNPPYYLLVRITLWDKKDIKTLLKCGKVLLPKFQEATNLELMLSGFRVDSELPTNEHLVNLWRLPNPAELKKKLLKDRRAAGDGGGKPEEWNELRALFEAMGTVHNIPEYGEVDDMVQFEVQDIVTPVLADVIPGTDAFAPLMRKQRGAKDAFAPGEFDIYYAMVTWELETKQIEYFWWEMLNLIKTANHPDPEDETSKEQFQKIYHLGTMYSVTGLVNRYVQFWAKIGPRASAVGAIEEQLKRQVERFPIAQLLKPRVDLLRNSIREKGQVLAYDPLARKVPEAEQEAPPAVAAPVLAMPTAMAAHGRK